MKAGRICQILRSLILQYCTMNIPIRSMGVTEGNAGGKVGGPFLIRTVYLVSTKNKIKTLVSLSLPHPSHR